MVIPAKNTLPQEVWVPRTFLSFNEVAGTNVLRWQNPNGFNASWAVQIGETGEEQTEIVLLGASTPAGTAGTLTANTLYEHPVNTPIYGIKYNQLVFERSTTGTAGTAAPMTNGTVTIQADKPVTIFDDTSGTSTYAYRTYFRNSVLAVNSIESDWITSAGFDFYSLASIRQRVKDKLWNSDYVSDSMINDWINEWKDDMTNSIVSINEDYALGTADIAFDATNGYGTITTTDFSQVRKLWITYNGQDFFMSTKMPVNYPIPNQVFSTTHPYHAYTGYNTFQILPVNGGGTARVTFYRFGTTLVNDTDTLPQPMRSYTKSFTDYCLAQALYKDNKAQEADRRLVTAEKSKQEFILNSTPRDKSGPTMMQILEPITGDDRGYM